MKIGIEIKLYTSYILKYIINILILNLKLHTVLVIWNVKLDKLTNILRFVTHEILKNLKSNFFYLGYLYY